MPYSKFRYIGNKIINQDYNTVEDNECEKRSRMYDS
jgi:hypothetical protein